MKQNCQSCSDKNSLRRIYGILGKDGRLYRLTFSKALAKHICENHGYTYRRFKYFIGKRLDDNETSYNGLYGIISYNGAALRISLDKEIGNMLIDNNYRFLHEIYLG